MTVPDNEIIKALECCIKGCNAEGCDDCPLYEKVEDCEIEIPIIALDLINRQKTEIVRLQSMNQAKLDIIHDIREELETAKSEAIREFTEELKKRADKKTFKRLDGVELVLNYQISPVTIFSLIREMTEAEK